MSIIKALSNKFVLLSLSFLSGVISAYDNVLNVIFYETLPKMELNPLASMIIEAHGVDGLVTIKATGTLLAVTWMSFLVKTKYKYVVYPVTLVQTCLFYFLTFYTNDPDTFMSNDWLLPLEMFFEFYS